MSKSIKELIRMPVQSLCIGLLFVLCHIFFTVSRCKTAYIKAIGTQNITLPYKIDNISRL